MTMRHWAVGTMLATAMLPLHSAIGQDAVQYGIHRVIDAAPPGAPVPAPDMFPALKPVRLIVLTDIGNEPDDSESLVRLLTYANDFDLAGLVATTSASLPDQIHPELLEQRIRAYGTVLGNLRRHDKRYPSEQKLLSLVRKGSAVYGMAGVGDGKSTPGSDLIVQTVDASADAPVWITIWGGAGDLAQALHDVSAKRSEQDVARFVSRLRVFAISDQDDAGPLIRQRYPGLFWIGSIHAFRDYAVAGWTGISRDIALPSPATDAKLVDHDWQKMIQTMGPLGAQYPLSTGLMEGDTPSFLGLIPNGINVPERPDYGGWGGRYGKVHPALGLYADASDAVVGKDGVTQKTAEATIWRWREAVQNDFLARLKWSMTSDPRKANHAPEPVVNGAKGLEPIVIKARAGDRVRLSAAGSSDPDGDALTYRWWQYREPTFVIGRRVRNLEIAGADMQEASVTVPAIDPHAPADYHVVLEVSDAGSPKLTRYRRVIVKITD